MPSNNYVDTDSFTSLFPSIDGWSCPACSFDNSSTNYPTCEMCHQIDPQINGNSSISKPMWRCLSCAWQNNADNVFCESCYQTKSSSVNI